MINLKAAEDLHIGICTLREYNIIYYNNIVFLHARIKTNNIFNICRTHCKTRGNPASNICIHTRSHAAIISFGGLWLIARVMSSHVVTV